MGATRSRAILMDPALLTLQKHESLRRERSASIISAQKSRQLMCSIETHDIPRINSPIRRVLQR